MRVTVAGSGYVGLVVSACFADTGNDVVGYDIDARKVRELNKGKNPIFEPGLTELLVHGRQTGRLRFTTDLKDALRGVDAVFIAIGTAPRPDGSADLSGIEAFARSLAPLVERPLPVAIKSTVPVGTGEHVEKMIMESSRHAVHLVSNPEFLKEGSAVQDFQRPDRVVIGFEHAESGEIIRELYSPFVRNQKPILMMGRRAAEMAKYACNGILASRISFINEIANLCDACSVDVDDVRRVMGTDTRIGFQFLYPGAGYGGSCFPKDVRALIHTATSLDVPPRMLTATHETNEAQKSVLFRKVQRRFGDLAGKTLAVWGIAFKPNTDDIREAPSLTFIRQLREAGATVRAHDPEALEHLKAEFDDTGVVCFSDNYEALRGADALVICTEWNEFRSPDFVRIKGLLGRAIIFDGRNLYDSATMRRVAIEYHPIGKPPVIP